MKQVHAGFLLDLHFDPEDRRDTFLQNVRDFHQITRRHIPEAELCIATAVITSNPANWKTVINWMKFDAFTAVRL
jgi:hypothetical protein